MPVVEEIQIRERQCGLRKPGGLYLVGDCPEEDMNGWLPRACRCTCGIKFLKGSRNVQKFVPYDAFPELRPGSTDPRKFATFLPDETVWVVTIGEKHYPTVYSYLHEAREQGISRYIQEFPRGFKIGESWVFLLHPTAFQREVPVSPGEKQRYVKEPGIIAVFKPKAIQYVVTGDETEEYLDGLQSKGVTLVSVSYI